MTPSSFMGSYELKERLGRGSMGDVYRASKMHTDELVAIKVLRGDFSEDQELLARFLQERTVLLRLDSPSLVRVRDLIIEGGAAAIVMDLMDGGDLRQRLSAQGSLSYSEGAALMVAVFSALETVHHAGILHRDIKPANLLFSSDGSIHLADFGIAKLLDQPHFTQTYGFLGTPSYMAPEMGLDGEVTPACDVYSAGIVLYEMLTGQLPFRSKSPLNLMRLHAEALVTYPHGFPPVLEDFLNGALAKSPASRPSAQEAKAALENMLALNQLAGFTSLNPLRVGDAALLGDLDFDIDELAVKAPSAAPNNILVTPPLEWQDTSVSETQISMRRGRQKSVERIQTDSLPVKPAVVETIPDRVRSGSHFSLGSLRKRPILLLLLVAALGLALLGSLLFTGTASAQKPDSPVVTAVVKNGQIALSWPKPKDSGPPITSYIVSDGVAPPRSIANTRTFVFANLVPGKTYSFSVKAINRAGESSAKVVQAKYYTKPRAPKVRARLVNGNLKVTWNAPKDNGAPITSYRVSDGVSSARTSGSKKSFTFPNAISGKTYRVTVRAINRAGPSRVSPPAILHVAAKTVATVPIAPTTKHGTKPKPKPVTKHSTTPGVRQVAQPKPPHILGVTPISGQTNAVNVTWSPPVNLKGYHLLDYTLEVYNVAESVVTRYSVTGTSTAYVVSPLSGGTNKFTLVANFEKNGTSTVLQYSSPPVTF